MILRRGLSNIYRPAGYTRAVRHQPPLPPAWQSNGWGLAGFVTKTPKLWNYCTLYYFCDWNLEDLTLFIFSINKSPHKKEPDGSDAKITPCKRHRQIPNMVIIVVKRQIESMHWLLYTTQTVLFKLFWFFPPTNLVAAYTTSTGKVKSAFVRLTFLWFCSPQSAESSNKNRFIPPVALLLNSQ